MYMVGAGARGVGLAAFGRGAPLLERERANEGGEGCGRRVRPKGWRCRGLDACV